MKKALLLALLFLTPIAALGMLKYDIQQGGAYSLNFISPNSSKFIKGGFGITDSIKKITLALNKTDIPALKELYNQPKVKQELLFLFVWGLKNFESGLAQKIIQVDINPNEKIKINSFKFDPSLIQDYVTDRFTHNAEFNSQILQAYNFLKNNGFTFNQTHANKILEKENYYKNQLKTIRENIIFKWNKTLGAIEAVLERFNKITPQEIQEINTQNIKVIIDLPAARLVLGKNYTIPEGKDNLAISKKVFNDMFTKLENKQELNKIINRDIQEETTKKKNKIKPLEILRKAIAQDLKNK